MAISEYLPRVPPNELSPQARTYLEEELNRIAELINTHEICIPPLAAEPAQPEDGMLVYANGTDWNPGSGEGFYGYENGSWVKL